MTRKATAALLTVPLDSAAKEPLFHQLYEGLRRGILEGRLPAGMRLPATRQLAADLGISRNTVLGAYDQLLAEGYLEGKHGSGTYVPRALPDRMVPLPPIVPRERANRDRVASDGAASPCRPACWPSPTR